LPHPIQVLVLELQSEERSIYIITKYE
jgi:hypothetical protein